MTAWSPSSTDPAARPAGALSLGALPFGAVARGRLRPPGSKSLTHRAFALALLSRRPFVVAHPLVADDTGLALGALERFGFAVHPGRDEVAITAPSELPGGAEIDCGNAGTLLRFLVAISATIPGRWRLDGTARLRQRPVGALIAALRTLGAEIQCERRDGFVPLVVHGGSLAGGRVRLDAGESSQYLSALLLAGQCAAGPLTIEVEALASPPYVDLTVDLLRRFGGRVEHDGARVWISRPSELAGGRYEVEPDLSAAAYPAAAAALTGGDLLMHGVSLASRQGDRRLFEVLERMGAVVTEGEAGVRVRGGELVAFTDDLADIPDQVPTLAALAPFARGTTTIENVAHLRLKESDRLAVIASELRRAGATVEERPDGLVIPGIWAESEPPCDPVEIDPHDDHRIAMAMALVGLRRPNLTVRDPRVVAKSWPEYWSVMSAFMGSALPRPELK